MIPRLLEKYRKEIVPAVMAKHGLKNVFEVPRLEKIIVNMGVGAVAHEIKVLEEAREELALITGQRPVITKARKAISNFKIRKGSPVGCKVTLRGFKMYEFLDRLVNVTFPRIKDFQGFPARSFGGSGNYSLGLSEQNMFPEIDIDKMHRLQGMDITIATTAKTDELAREVLKAFNFPFRT